MKKFYSLGMFAARVDEGAGLIFSVCSSVTSAYSKEEAEKIATKTIEERCKASEGWAEHMVSAREFTVERRYLNMDQDSNAEALVM